MGHHVKECTTKVARKTRHEAELEKVEVRKLM